MKGTTLPILNESFNLFFYLWQVDSIGCFGKIVGEKDLVCPTWVGETLTATRFQHLVRSSEEKNNFRESFFEIPNHTICLFARKTLVELKPKKLFSKSFALYFCFPIMENGHQPHGRALYWFVHRDPCDISLFTGVYSRAYFQGCIDYCHVFFLKKLPQSTFLLRLGHMANNQVMKHVLLRSSNVWQAEGQNKGRWIDTVDGSEILHQLRLVVYPIICRVLYIPGGAGFLPSTVCRWLREF